MMSLAIDTFINMVKGIKDDLNETEYTDPEACTQKQNIHMQKDRISCKYESITHTKKE